MRKSRSKIESYVPVVALIACTFLSSAETLDATMVPRQIALIALTIIGVILIGRRTLIGEVDIDVLKHPAFILMYICLVWSYFCHFFAGNVPETFMQTSRLFVYAVFTVCCALTVKREMISKASLILAVIVSGYALYQYFTTDFLGVQAWQSNRNLCCSAIFLLGMLGLNSELGKKEIIALVFIAGVLVLLANRTVYLAMTVSGLILLSKRLRYLIPSIVVIIVLVLCARHYKPKLFNSESLRARVNLWTVSARMGNGNPLVGVGPGNWRIEYPLYASNGFTGSVDKKDNNRIYQNIFYQRAHNDFLSMFAECGLIGGVCYLGMILCAMRTNRTLLAGLIGYCVIASFGFPMERACQGIILCVMIALSVKTRGNTVFHPRKTYIPLFMIVMTLMACLSVNLEAYSSEVTMRKMSYLRSQKQWKALLKISEGLFCLDPLSTPIPFYRGEAYLNLKQIDDAVIEYEIAGFQNPNHVFVLSELGSVYAMKGRLKESVKCYEQALRLNPNFDMLQQNLNEVKRVIRAGAVPPSQAPPALISR